MLFFCMACRCNAEFWSPLKSVLGSFLNVEIRPKSSWILILMLNFDRKWGQNSTFKFFIINDRICHNLYHSFESTYALFWSLYWAFSPNFLSPSTLHFRILFYRQNTNHKKMESGGSEEIRTTKHSDQVSF